MDVDQILKEISFKAMRSGGPGGQHVNKTSSKVEISFNVMDSSALTDSEKELLRNRLGNWISADGIISFQSSDSRSQHRNKAFAIDKLIQFLEEHLKVKKTRKKTKPSRSAIERRLKAKRIQSWKKENRKPPEF